MSLLSVTVKKARFVGAQAIQWNSYATLKLQNVKSTTVTVKGATPSWEQDFLFEINNLDTGLLIEVWNKGRIWDKVIGYHWLHLRDIHHSNVVSLDEGAGQWLSLEAELVMRDGEVVGTKTPTGHVLLVDARFELPYAADLDGDEAIDLQRKLEMLNSMLDQEARAEQARKQHQYYIQSGVSEDSDYTSDVNYPVGQHPNSSASQFLSAAHQLTTPQRSLDSSRENSYEKDDDYRGNNGHSSYHSHPHHPPPYSTHRKQLPNIPTQQHLHQKPHGYSRNSQQQYWDDPRDLETDPLYYNSRPHKNYKSYTRYSYRHEDSYVRQYSDDYEDAQDYSQPPHNYAKRLKNSRRGTPSLERQDTLYDDGTGDYHQTDVQDSNSHPPSRRYSNDRYSSYERNHYNAHKDTVYDDYSQQYSDYGPDGTAYDDGSSTLQSEVVVGGDKYANDTSYSNQGWSNEGDSRDHYSSTKYSKELPQLPHHHRQPPSQSQSPYASQSTVKELSAPSSAVPSIIASHHEDPVSSTIDTVVTSSGYGHVNDDRSFYDDSAYNTLAPVVTSSSAGGGHAVVPTSAAVETNEEYVDAYETQAGYEDWQNYGYYDETGNYVQYDQNSYYDESGNLITTGVGGTGEQEQYGYYDQPATSLGVEGGGHATTGGDLLNAQQSQTYQQYDNMDYYNSTATATSTADQEYAYDGNEPQSFHAYDDYSYEKSGYDQTKTEPSQLPPKQDSKAVTRLSSQSSVEYNYAYQSAENLSSYDNNYPSVERSNSISRRASFRRQTSTRDYGMTEGGPQGHPSTTAPISSAIPPSTTTVHATTSSTAATAAGTAAAAATKLTSALPQLPSLTKGSELFSSSISKIGLFVSSAAAKTGELIHKDANKEKDKVAPVPATSTITITTTAPPTNVQPNVSMDMGLGYSLEYQQYEQWDGRYDDELIEGTRQFEAQDGAYEQYERTEEGQEGNYPSGPVHMDSLESNTSDPARDSDADKFEAQYWQKQQERIAKQSTLPDPYANEGKANLLEPMEPVINGTVKGAEIIHSRRSSTLSQEDSFSTKQNSLDREQEEWMSGLDRQGSRIRAPHIANHKKDMMSMSVDQSLSLDRHPEEEEDEYMLEEEEEERQRQYRKPSVCSGDSAGSIPTSSPPIKHETEEGSMIALQEERKSSLEVPPGKDKSGSKSVSFDEEPPKVIVPERQTKGMTPKQKWLWAMNRICSQLAVSPFNL